MAAELVYRADSTGSTMRGTLKKEATTGGKVQMIVVSTGAAEDLTVANWANYLITLTETPASSYTYIGDMPANVAAGWYYVDIYSGTAISSTLVETQFGYWDGTSWILGESNIHQATAFALFDSIVGLPIAGSIAAEAILARTYADNAATDAATAATQATNAASDAASILAKLLGITVLANWLRGFFRKSTMDATAKSEVNTGGGTYNETTDSLEAIRDTEPLGAAMRGTDGALTSLGTNAPSGWINAAAVAAAALNGKGDWNTTTPPTANANATAAAAAILATPANKLVTNASGQVEASNSSGLTAQQATQLAKLAARFCGTDGKVVLDLAGGTLKVYNADNSTLLFQQAFTLTATTQTFNAAT